MENLQQRIGLKYIKYPCFSLILGFYITGPNVTYFDRFPSLPHIRQFNTSFFHKGHSFSTPKSREFHTLVQPNPTVQHKSDSSTQIRQFNTNPSILHESVTSTRLLNRKPSSANPKNVELAYKEFFCRSDVTCMLLTDLYGTD